MGKKRSKKIFIEGTINEDNQKLLDKYIKYMKVKELSDTTIRNYTYELESWLRFLDEVKVVDIKTEDIEDYIFEMKYEGNNTNRLKFKLSTISAFFIFLKKRKIVKENPVELIDRPKKADEVVQQNYLTLEQVEELKKKLHEQDNLQLEVYVNLALITMARVNALSNIMWKNIDWDNNMIVDIVEKEGYVVTLFIDDYTKELLHSLRKDRRNKDIRNPYVFITRYNNKWNKVTNITLNNWTKIAGQLINVPELHNHDFRHTTATLLKNQGMPLEDISKLLHHSGTDVTLKHYIKEDQNKLQETLNNFNPFGNKK